MSNIDEILIDRELVRYASHFTQEPLALASLFPEQKKATLDLKMFKGANNIPVSAEVHAFDSETQLADFESNTYDVATMLLVKRQYHIGEELLIRLNQTNSDPVKQEIKEEIYGGIRNNLLQSIAVRFERMRADLIQYGKLTLNENGYKGLLDYGMPKSNLVTADWTNADTAKPLDDIEKWCDIVEDGSGVRPTRVITRRIKVREMLNNTSVRKAVLGTEADRRLTLNMYNDFAQEEGLPTIGIYEGYYRQQLPSGKKVVKKYINDKSFILLPPYAIGNTFYGPTAEETELAKDAAIEVTQNNYITLTTYREPDSPSKFVKGSATGLPTAPYINEVLTATIE